MNLKTAIDIIDPLTKGGKRAVVGEIRTFGGREYVKTQDGWKFHGKGTGKKAKAHKEKATSGEKKEESTSQENNSKQIDSKQWLENEKLTDKLHVEDVDTAQKWIGDLTKVVGDKKAFYKALDGGRDFMSTKEISQTLSVRFQQKYGIYIQGNWSKKLYVAKRLEEVCDGLPAGFLKNNPKLLGFRSQDAAENVDYAHYINGFIDLSEKLTKGAKRINGRFKEVIIHEIGHSVASKTEQNPFHWKEEDGTISLKRKASGEYLKFAKLCGWSEETTNTLATGYDEKVKRIGRHRLITNYSEVSAEEAFAEYFSSYINNKKIIDKAIENDMPYVRIEYQDSDGTNARPLTREDLQIYSQMKKMVFENKDLIKALQIVELFT
jgi:hypothetical protein